MSADQDEIERQAALLRERWKADRPRKTNPLDDLDDDQKRMAARVVGHEGLKSIENSKEGRRVYVAPVRVTYEWYWVKGDWSHMTIWRINRVENGRQRVTHKEGYLEDDLHDEIAALVDKGHRVSDNNLDTERTGGRKPIPSKRKAIINSLRYYRP